MKKLIPFLLALVLTSCATYTVSQAKDSIYGSEANILYPQSFFLEDVKIPEYSKELSSMLIPVENDKELVPSYLKVINKYDPTIIMLTGSKNVCRDIVKELGRPSVIYKDNGTIISKFPIEIGSSKVIVHLGDEKTIEVAVRTIGKETDLTKLDSNLKELENISNFKKEKIAKSLNSLNKTSVILGLSSFEPSTKDWTEGLKAFPYRQNNNWAISDYLESIHFVDSFYDTNGSSNPQFAFTWSDSTIRERSDFIYLYKAIATNSERVNLYEASEVHASHLVGRFGIFTNLVLLEK